MSAIPLDVEIDGAMHRVLLTREQSGAYFAEIDGLSMRVDVCHPEAGVLSLLIEGRAHRCVLVKGEEERSVAIAGALHRVAAADPRSLRAQRQRPGGGNGATQVKASMPGRVARVLVAPGDAVVAQQGIVVIEAMKMQNELKAARDGRVAEVRVAAGDTVTSGQVLAVLE